MAWLFRKPSKILDMRAIARPWLIRNGYDGLTFFGRIITHSREEAEALNGVAGFKVQGQGAKNHDSGFKVLKNHEMIHLYQARSCRDSWLLFYLRYGWYWLQTVVGLWRLPKAERRKVRNGSYRLNPFEMEAYRYMHDLHYLDDKESGTTEWHRYANMSLRERINLLTASL